VTRRLLTLAACALTTVGCVEPGPIIGSQRRAAGGGDGAAELSVDAAREASGDAGCVIPIEGCCDGETLWWCQGGALKTLRCGSALRCGWSTASAIYDCNTAGAQDPAGLHPRECVLLGVKLPTSDGGVVGDAGRGCGQITRVGCCAGNVLRYCDSGELKSLSCGLNPTCGWLPNGQYYDCGTEGKVDPSGKHARDCPKPWTEAGGWIEASADLTSREAGAGDAGDTKGSPDCSCRVGAPGSPRAVLALLVLAAMAFTLGRRRR